MIIAAFIRSFMALVLIFFASPAIAAGVSLPQDQSRAVVLSYINISNDEQKEGALSSAKFLQHIEAITNGSYTVLPLNEILNAIVNDQKLPPKTLALTFDGAYRSTFENAFPLLIEKNIPFTVFYTSNALDTSSADSITWKELKDLAQNKNVTLGLLPDLYDHTAYKTNRGIIVDLNRARQRHRENFNREADLLAYNFGEYSLELKTLSQKQGFKAAFGLQSGVLNVDSDLFALPRFSMTDRYGDLQRFEMVANALPFPVSDLTPQDPLLRDDNTEWFGGFTLPDALVKTSESLSCFISGLTQVEIEKIGARIEMRSPVSTLNQRRMRLNCIMRGPDTEDKKPQWRWMGILYHRNIPKNALESENQTAANPEPLELPAPQE